MKWMTQQQAAERYDVSERTIRNWVTKHRARLVIRRAGKFVFYRVPEFDQIERDISASYSGVFR